MSLPHHHTTGIAKHYDAITQHASATFGTRDARQKLRTFPLRQYNNAVKRRLLEGVAKNCVTSRPRVLDVCCGRGGDILKYEQALLASFVKFVDVSPEAVAESRRRFMTMRDQGQVGFDAEFTVQDCFASDFADSLQPQTFDVVVCNFALHYAFASKDRVDNVLSAMYRALAPGGYFVATFPSSTAIRDRATAFGRHKTWKAFGNSYMRVEFEEELQTRYHQLGGYGLRYHFSLEDAIDNCPEFLVPETLLIAQLEAHGFSRLFAMGFMTVAAQLPGLMHKLPADPELRDIASLYACVACVKPVLPKLVSAAEADRENFVGRLQTWTQLRGLPLPVYRDWPVHDWRLWQVGVSVVVSSQQQQQQDPLRVVGESFPSKREAKQNAAMKMLCLVRDHEAVAMNGSENMENNNHHDQLHLTQPRVTMETCDLLVLIDADHISFIDHETVCNFPSVYFAFFCGHSATLGASVTEAVREHGNAELRRATSPLKNLADSMMLVCAAQFAVQRPKTPQVVVSRDATVFHACVLLENVTCATDQTTLDEILHDKI